MQYQQALNEIEQVKRIYRKGCITLGEYLVKLGSILVSFELEITRNDTDSSFTILSEHEEYNNLHKAIAEALR